MRHARRINTSAVIAAALLGAAQTATAVTEICIGTNVLVADVTRLGINLGGNNYWDAPTTKVRDTLNFEGVLFRQCHLGNLYDDGFGSIAMDTNQMTANGWADVLRGGQYRILGGAWHNTTGTIVAVTNRLIRTWDDARSNMQAFFVFDRPVGLPPGTTVNQIGLLAENTRAEHGSIQREYPSWWMTSNCTLHYGDVSLDSWGRTALRMRGSAAEASFRLSTCMQNLMDNNGAWEVRFRAKALSNTPILRLSVDFATAPVRTVMPEAVWITYTQNVTIAGVSGATAPAFLMRVTGGDALIDDIEVETRAHTNATAFLDELLTTLRALRPGILRQLQMGGSTVSNSLLPPVRSAAYRSAPWDSCSPYRGPGPHSYGLHQLYALCEHIDAEPWFCLPGTLHPEELAQFMEYLAGPANSGMGAVRAAMGHPAPWTETLRRIHVEFGNEAWNWFGPYVAGGFNRMDYWSNLIAVAKASPYYTNTVLFHAAGQNFDAWWARQIISYATNCDRYAIAPYIMHELNTNDLARYASDDDLFRWLFAYPLMTTFSNGMPQQMTVSRSLGKEYSIYEINHHITGGNAPAAARNKLVASLGGGVSVINTMLALLKHCGIRSQCFFNLMQQSYNGIALWGAVLNNKPGSERCRPTALALMAANRVMAGNLVATHHALEDPHFTAFGRFEGFGSVITTSFPVLHSYAFRDGMHRGLIIANLDVVSNRTMRLRLPPGEGASGLVARAWLLTSGAITNNNELDTGVPQVTLAESLVAGFSNGFTWTIPPFSLQSLSWHITTNPQNARVLINGGAPETTSPVVSLTLHADDPQPAAMQVTETNDFSAAVWTNYAGTLAWTFEATPGRKTIYARFRAEGGGISDVAEATIILVPEPVLALLAGGASVALCRHRARLR